MKRISAVKIKLILSLSINNEVNVTAMLASGTAKNLNGSMCRL